MFESIIGQEKAKSQIDTILKTGKIANAYMFCGPEGVGKKLMAKEFSKELIKMDLDSSQDFILIDPKEGESSIKIEQIRNIVDNISIKPYGDYKIFVINDAEKMTIPAQNSLLKTLEEPPNYGIIILITKNKQSLLETIRSRCTEIQFSPLSVENMRVILKNKQIPDEICNLTLNLSKSYGSLSYAINLCENEDILKMRNLCEDFFDYIFIKKSKFQALKTPEYFLDYKKDIKIIIDFLKSYTRDCILLKEGIDKGLLINSDRYDFLFEISKNTSSYVLGRLIDLLDETNRKLNSNCNFNTTIESLAIRIYSEVNNAQSI